MPKNALFSLKIVKSAKRWGLHFMQLPYIRWLDFAFAYFIRRLLENFALRFRASDGEFIDTRLVRAFGTFNAKPPQSVWFVPL